jgi:hypothetical protein
VVGKTGLSSWVFRSRCCPMVTGRARWSTGLLRAGIDLVLDALSFDDLL